MSPGITHETLRQLPHHNPHLVVVLANHLGVAMPATAKVVGVDGDVSSPSPTGVKQLLADKIFLATAPHYRRSVIYEPQSQSPTAQKRYSMVGYVGMAVSNYQCKTSLIVAALNAATAKACAKTIEAGAVQLTPLVVGPGTTPDPTDPPNALANPQLTVLACINKSFDLSIGANQDWVLAQLAPLNEDLRDQYTYVIQLAASKTARAALEEKMTIQYHNHFMDKYVEQGIAKGVEQGIARGIAQGIEQGIEQGMAEGEAKLLLRILETRFAIGSDVRERVGTCRDTAQLETWTDRALKADSVDAVFQ